MTDHASASTARTPRATLPQRVWREARRSPSSMLGLSLLGIYLLVAIAAPLLTSGDPLFMERGSELAAPSIRHPLGTDEFGRDLWTRIVFGARISLAIGFGGVFAATLLGTLLGLISGYAGHYVDTAIMRVMDTLLAFPGILIGIIAVVLLGAGPRNVAIAVAVAHTPLMARLVRGEVLRERDRDYVQAAQALGARNRRILFRHLLPNTTGVILVQIATSLGVAILLEAALSFLGLGTQPPAPSWGAMLRDARPYLREASWYAIAPGVALSLLVVAVNYTSNAIRRALDRSSS